MWRLLAATLLRVCTCSDWTWEPWGSACARRWLWLRELLRVLDPSLQPSLCCGNRHQPQTNWNCEESGNSFRKYITPILHVSRCDYDGLNPSRRKKIWPNPLHWILAPVQWSPQLPSLGSRTLKSEQWVWIRIRLGPTDESTKASPCHCRRIYQRRRLESKGAIGLVLPNWGRFGLHC